MIAKRKLPVGKPNGSLIVPMAGLGRFVNENYSLAKTLIPVSGRSMITQATIDLPRSQNQIFVLRSDMQGYDPYQVNYDHNFQKHF